MAERPGITFSGGNDGRILFLEGAWSAAYADDTERTALLIEKTSFAEHVVIDLRRLVALDTLGALLINRTLMAPRRLRLGWPRHGP